MPIPGCIFDSHRGHYIIPEIITYAEELGRPTDPFVKFTLTRYDEQYHTDEYPTSAMDDEHEKAIDWLNENIAPEGYSFGHNDGDFGLYPQEG